MSDRGRIEIARCGNSGPGAGTVPSVRQVAAAVGAFMMLGSLAACSPAINSTVGIGYDRDGRLIGAVKVCDDHVVAAAMAPSSPEEAPLFGDWRRDSPLSAGTETWLLDGSVGPWKSIGPSLTQLDPDTEYLFAVSDENITASSRSVVFYGRDLAELLPGELLVRRDGPGHDSHGDLEVRVTVIKIDELAAESC